ncbi:glycoside hydrolase [Pontibacter diazotrophicus]|uniref:Glycoside hydrolase n=1 Tax=Pontibacter diazotrophicus TaxID=1400979 RepID=A0A3D8L233_9BACT|nr:cellulase family glycosylhydrolase [Pontibacter diazotrophicus]RDV11488.1 glycoside hydrolase [Pontibacter diazotrophicus]
MKFEVLNRRHFIKLGISATAIGLVGVPFSLSARDKPNPNHLPRWRGFNLLEKFNDARNQPYQESDFQLMAEWGFDFARLPMSYHCWSKPDNWLQMDEKVLKEIDQAVAYGRKHKVHVNLNFHRIPGYCVNPPEEPLNLWKDEKALEAAAFHWQTFAKRYKGIPNEELSFDLINEPSKVEEPDYVRVVTRLVEAIRSEDPERLIIADGMQYGTKPVFGIKDLQVGQSTRGYGPFQLTHYKASWASGSDTWPLPTWPYKQTETDVWDKARLQREVFEPWKKLSNENVGVHVGEWGAYKHTPHDVSLAWMKDNLEIWKENGWGWALWNLRGEFGVLNSGRADVAYEDYKGHKLDRKMLTLLQAY